MDARGSNGDRSGGGGCMKKVPGKFYAEIDWAAFASDVSAAIQRLHGSYDKCVGAHHGLNKATLSHACNAQPLSAALFMHVCVCLRLSPFEYHAVHKKEQEIQPVKVPVSRVTPRNKFAHIARKHARSPR